MHYLATARTRGRWEWVCQPLLRGRVGGVIALSGNDAAWLTVCTDVSPAVVPTACQENICSDLAACPGSKACASSDDCPASCVSVNVHQRRQLLFGSIPIPAECPKGCVAAYSSP